MSCNQNLGGSLGTFHRLCQHSIADFHSHSNNLKYKIIDLSTKAAMKMRKITWYEEDCNDQDREHCW